MSRKLTALTMVAVYSLSAACDRAPTRPETMSPTEQFASALRSQGLDIAVEGTEPQSSFPFFSPQGVRLAVRTSVIHGPGRILVFEYSSAAAARAESERVQPDGQLGPTVLILWVATPHFFRKDRLVVLYVGCDSEILTALGRVAGPPLGIGPTPCTTSGL